MRIIITRREHLDALDGISRFVFTLGEGMRKLGNELFFPLYITLDATFPLWKDGVPMLNIRLFQSLSL